MLRTTAQENAQKGARGGGGPYHGLLKHLSEDDLVLYRHGEIRTAPTEGHLSVCRGCRDRLSVLRLDPDALTPPPAVLGRPRQKPVPVGKNSLWRRLLRLVRP